MVASRLASLRHNQGVPTLLADEILLSLAETATTSAILLLSLLQGGLGNDLERGKLGLFVLEFSDSPGILFLLIAELVQLVTLPCRLLGGGARRADQLPQLLLVLFELLSQHGVDLVRHSFFSRLLFDQARDHLEAGLELLYLGLALGAAMELSLVLTAASQVSLVAIVGCDRLALGVFETAELKPRELEHH